MLHNFQESINRQAQKKRNKQKVIQNSHGIVRQEHFFGFLFFS